MQSLIERVRDTRDRARAMGDGSLVAECDAYLLRMGVVPVEAALPAVEERAVPPRPAPMRKGR